MTKTLLLMDHSKIAARPPELPDKPSLLMRAGRRALAASLPRTLSLWKGSAPEVWTPRIVVIYITAQVLAKAFERRGEKAVEAKERRFLADRDYDALVRAVAASDADAIAVVAEGDFVADACEQLTGTRLPFSHGAMAVIELPNMPSCAERGPQSEDGDAQSAPAADPATTAQDEEEPLPPLDPAALRGARLLWFVQGPDVAPWCTLIELEGVLRDAAERMGKRLNAFLEAPDDAEALHKLRVSIRTLRSLLRFVAPWQKRRVARGIQKDLRAIVAPTSRLRELDVLAAEARQMDPPAEELAQACQALRDEERDRVLAALSGDEARRVLDRVVDATGPAAWRRSIERKGLARERVAQRFADLRQGVERRIDSTDLADEEAAHGLRKAAKRMRYAAEGFASFLDADEAEATRARMKAVQDDLGALCDARVNAEIVGEFPREGLSEQALLDLAALEARSRYLIAAKLRDARRREA